MKKLNRVLSLSAAAALALSLTACSGGGTAGHVTPNLALLPQLRAAGYCIHYVGTADGIERSLVEGETDVCYHAISAGKLRR